MASSRNQQPNRRRRADRLLPITNFDHARLPACKRLPMSVPIVNIHQDRLYTFLTEAKATLVEEKKSLEASLALRVEEIEAAREEICELKVKVARLEQQRQGPSVSSQCGPRRCTTSRQQVLSMLQMGRC